MTCLPQKVSRPPESAEHPAKKHLGNQGLRNKENELIILKWRKTVLIC
jgi:hypothetical protein